MIQLEKNERKLLYPLFKDMHDTLILTCLEGHMGDAYVDQLPEPSCAKLIIADFCFIAGNTTSEFAEDIVSFTPKEYQNDFLIYVTQNDEWNKLLEQCYGEKCKSFIRYAFYKDASNMKPIKLKEYIQSLPSEYEIKQIDEVIYHQIMLESWSKDLCSSFLTAEDYITRGIGFAVVKDSEIVAGASSYTIYDGGIEIELDTKPEYRQKGLATAVASALILYCLEHDIYPSWDAANLTSVKIATKLGYQFDKEYTCYYVKM
ncbi:GNAT family N-acetyltransferase [Paludicola sp. MB14-C6]|uniref:GNAT family N-acetyltransferase n=1 Tax=Paludihabitans sp. MB14-C6 TaxID=3070656 RepID=UPI0027DBD364|nr:GNAT family N-acetyltransferase [Paludicola sp. MB14-C6]WMJ23650.1 GNAT family N-acetyltransferase [Paludicola sp. MB14-C6]